MMLIPRSDRQPAVGLLAHVSLAWNRAAPAPAPRSQEIQFAIAFVSGPRFPHTPPKVRVNALMLQE